ncbi:MAG: hypothetical protein ACOYEV_16095 [Candidatus Nanopelagicales bacterium]
MTATATDAAIAEEPPAARPHQQVTMSRLVLRWAYIAALTLFAFHETLRSLYQSTVAGSLNGYIWMMPVAAVVAAIGVARRNRTELPIHDRQTDVIVGTIGLIFSLMLQWVLLPRYGQTFHLLRIDLVAMWMFVLSSSIVLFGLRPIIRFGSVWLLLTMSFPLGYQLSVIVFGGNRPAAGGACMVIAAVATAISVGRNSGRAAVGAIAALTVGLPVLTTMAVFTPNAPLLAFQMIPALTSMVAVGLAMYFLARRGRPKRLLDRRIEPVAATQIMAGVPAVLVVAVLISLVPLPRSAASPAQFSGMTFGRPLADPVDWHQTEEIDFPWVRRIYGHDATLIRQRFVADTGNPQWDKHAHPRTVVVDSTSTWRPFSLEVYPTVVVYDESSTRISDPRFIDLGHGITGSLVTVIDEKLLLTWNLLTWTWRAEGSAQRVTVAAVDNHEPDAMFPEPSGGLVPTLRTMIIILFRGNSATWDRDPTFKDADLLTTFAQRLINAQLVRAGEPL